MNFYKLILTTVIFIFSSLTLCASQLDHDIINNNIKNTIKSVTRQTIPNTSEEPNQSPTIIFNDNIYSPNPKLNPCQNDNAKSININNEDNLCTYNYTPTPDIFRHGFDSFTSRYDVRIHNNLLSNSQSINAYRPMSQSGIINQDNIGNVNSNLPMKQCFSACIADEESCLLRELAFNQNLTSTNIKLGKYHSRGINRDEILKSANPIWIGNINFIMSLIPDFPDINSEEVRLQIKESDLQSDICQDANFPYNNYSAFYTLTVLYNNNCKRIYRIGINVNDYLSYNKSDVFNGAATTKIKDLKNESSIQAICSNRKMCVKSYSILNSSYDAINNMFARRDIQIDVRYSYFEDDYADLLLGCIK